MTGSQNVPNTAEMDSQSLLSMMDHINDDFQVAHRQFQEAFLVYKALKKTLDAAKKDAKRRIDRDSRYKNALDRDEALEIEMATNFASLIIEVEEAEERKYNLEQQKERAYQELVTYRTLTEHKTSMVLAHNISRLANASKTWDRLLVGLEALANAVGAQTHE